MPRIWNSDIVQSATGIMNTAINMMAETNATRELSMVRTKIDEAMMWLERYQAGVCVDLAHKVCR